MNEKGSVLDLSEKLLDKVIKDAILEFEGLTPEEQIILLEEYAEKRYNIVYEKVRRAN